ncbi:hypothetical protein D3C73_1592830 [compost metagenome]
MAVHGEGGVVRIILQNVQRYVHHGQQVPARAFEGTAEFPVPVGIGYDLDLLNVRSVRFHRLRLL